jgi:hypothetical protein
MSISLDTKGALLITSSGTGTNGNVMTISAPTSLAAATAIAIPDPGAACNLMFGKKQVIAHNGAGPFTLTAAQSGSLINVTQQAGAVVCNLPAAAVGLEFDFVLNNNAAGSYTITSAGAAGTMKGTLMSSNGAAAVLVSTNGFNRANAIKAVFLAAGVAADRISVKCVDGTNWIATGFSGATDGNVLNT